MATAAVRSGGQSHHDAIFASVFPPHDHTTPTPEATPNLGTLSSPGTPFGGFNVPDDPVSRAADVNRAWSVVTRFLSIPSGLQPTRRHQQSPSAELAHALTFLLTNSTTNDDLRRWYIEEIRAHLQKFVLPELQFWQVPIAVTDAAVALSDTVAILDQAQQLYLDRLTSLRVNASFREAVNGFTVRIKQGWHILILHSLPSDRVQKTIASYLYHSMKSSLESSTTMEQCVVRGRCSCKLRIDHNLLTRLQDVGLGGAMGERALALAVNRMLAGPALERRCFEVNWSSRESIKTCLMSWIETIFSPSIERAILALTAAPSEHLVDQIQTISMDRLGLSRVRSLFDYVKRWPYSQGAILDIREYLAVHGPSEKAQLCSSFSEQMGRRLLHAGASTVEILSIYINVIHVFRALDSRGVLFEKVAIPIRQYLRSRDDTAAVIAASFLAEVDENGAVTSQDMDKICVDISFEIATSSLETDDDHSLRWDDMEWLPDPIDAGPDYKSTKADDILAYVLGLFEQDEFVKELLNFLGQHFLRSSDMEFAKETRLIELLKARLDPAKLQAAEVMLKDMRDSKFIDKRINPRQPLQQSTRAPTPREIQAAIPAEGITAAALYSLFKDRIGRNQFVAATRLIANRRNDLYYPKRARLPPERAQASAVADHEPDFSVKVLSGFFWPALRSDEFALPQQIQGKLEKYESRFASLGGQRRLEWRPALCTMHVELALEDRAIDERNVPAWRVAVINTFAASDADSDSVIQMSVPEICAKLGMDEELANDGVSFWLGKRVLHQTPGGKFAVLERLDMQVESSEVADTPLAESVSAVRTQDAMLREGAPMFETFIKSMLQNSGPKEIGGMMGIAGMLKMVLPTFTFGEEGVQWLLSQMESRGEVFRNGEMWAAAK